MKDELVRFGIAMEASLLDAFDEVVKVRGGSRSEVLRDLARAEVVRSQVRAGGPAVGALTIVYDHHVRELSEKLTDIQHELGNQVHCTTHVHLDHDRCLEVIVMHGQSGELQSIADRILATRGVIHGGLELITEVPHKSPWRRDGGASPQEPARAGHTHDHEHPHEPAKPKLAAAKPKRKAKTATTRRR